MRYPSTPGSWRLDPLDPRAPTLEQWDAMTPEERAVVVATLPAEPIPLQGMGEGDVHYEAVEEARWNLRRLFGKRGRSVYIGTGMTVYYPNESAFSPDVFAVLDVPTHPRSTWVVAQERRGLDMVIEVHVSGDRRKDTVTNVARYARLGIAEYFVLQPERSLLLGHRLEGEGGVYVALTPHRGRFTSRVLELELAFEDGRVRFYSEGGELPFQQEFIGKLETAVDGQLSRVAALERELEEERKAREEERKAREEERKAHEDVERLLAEAKAELERLRG